MAGMCIPLRQSWGDENWEAKNGEEEEEPERRAEAGATWPVHIGRLARRWAVRGHVSRGLLTFHLKSPIWKWFPSVSHLLPQHFGPHSMIIKLRKGCTNFRVVK